MSALFIGAVLLFFGLCLLRGLNPLPDQPTVYKNFTIIIAVKNEVENLSFLLVSLSSLDYFEGAFEVIFIDDHSTDQSFNILSDFCKDSDRYSVYQQLPDQYGKKAAITFGVSKAKYDWVALTDADCVVHPEWLKMINTHILGNEQVSMFVGYSPEIYIRSFQYFRQLATACIYAASIYSGFPYSCSGRNLIFSRKSFESVNGYEGFHHLPSGDDKILLQKFHRAKKSISYMPYPAIFTMPATETNIRNQNLRRYGKMSMSSLSWKIFLVLIGLSLVAIPIEFAFTLRLSILIIYILTTNLTILLGCVLHKEKYLPIYILHALIFPYYLLYQTSMSINKKWNWR